MTSTGDGRFGEKMNAATDLKTANSLLGRLEGIEANRRGVSRRQARHLVERQVQASPGTLENLRRMRLKAVPNWLMFRIRAQFVIALQHQVRQLGVTFDKRHKTKPWRARIIKERREIHLGNFATAEEAHDAYARNARSLFGEFARTR